jgi:hypothetical protein
MILEKCKTAATEPSVLTGSRSPGKNDRLTGIVLAPTGVVNVWSFVTLVLTALAVGAHTLYFYFGTVGAALELGALFSALVWIVPSSVPADWTWWRDQWEFTHTARAGLFLLSFCGLLGSVYAFRSRAGRPAGHPDPRRGGTTG